MKLEKVKSVKHSECFVQTTHFLKKCAILNDEDEGGSGSLQNPFKRGALTFEDYNYAMYNPYILIDKDGKKRH